MAEAASRPRVAVLSRTWGHAGNEAAFVDRQLAGAFSRVADVAVSIPGPPGQTVPDGAFDLHCVGADSHGSWPAEEACSLSSQPTPTLALVHSDDVGARELAERHAPGAQVVGIEAAVGRVGLHVAINPLAAAHRHNGLGFVGYVLVLSDRGLPDGDADVETSPRRAGHPTSAVAWITARFPRHNVVIVEDAVATVWRARALRGSVAVDSRTDLWRLMAHAQAVVDLDPGTIVARECVEAQRFGIPVIVPAGTTAADLAARGGGLWYRDLAGLLGCLDACADPAVHDVLSDRARAAADERYGDPDSFVDRVGALLAEAGTL